MDYRSAPTTPEPDRSLLVVGLKGKVYALDRATGDVRWQNDLPDGGRGEVALAVGYGVVIVSAFGSRIFCLDYLTGAERWSQSTQAGGRATVLIEPDQIVCAKGGYVDCYTPDGRSLWAQPLQGAGLGRVALGYPGNVVQADDPGSN